jgi:hypothetical protein
MCGRHGVTVSDYFTHSSQAALYLLEEMAEIRRFFQLACTLLQ